MNEYVLNVLKKIQISLIFIILGVFLIFHLYLGTDFAFRESFKDVKNENLYLLNLKLSDEAKSRTLKLLNNESKEEQERVVELKLAEIAEQIEELSIEEKQELKQQDMQIAKYYKIFYIVINITAIICATLAGLVFAFCFF